MQPYGHLFVSLTGVLVHFHAMCMSSWQIKQPSWPMEKKLFWLFHSFKKQKHTKNPQPNKSNTTKFKLLMCIVFNISQNNAESCEHVAVCDGSELDCWQIWSVFWRLVTVQILSASAISSVSLGGWINVSGHDAKPESLRRLGWKSLPSSDPISSHPLWYYTNWISGLMR